ncbi:MAG: acetylornithine/succinylornithine family transaminase [Polyangiaceae bacterium]|nr:acetylornithine/succinylornithine family transaminase [Polyangiaceae bacterium]
MSAAPSHAQSGSTAPVGASTNSESLVATAQKRLLGNYRQASFVLDRGRGCEVFDVEGKRYLDFAAGVAVDALGHAHPVLTKAIADQAGRLMHVSNYFYNAENIRLADELCAVTGFDRAFFCNSGAEANEAVMKLARRHFYAKGDKNRVRFIAFHNSFHGRTMGSVALTGTPKYHEGFGPMVGAITHVAYGDLSAAKAVMGADVAGIFVEPVQGEGGVMPAPPGYLAALRALADEHGALLLIDEVQTGMGRTGKWLGSDHEGVRADAIALAKGLGGGFPIGAMLVRESVAGALPPGTHGSTFGGNALASVAARTVLRVLKEEKLIDGARDRGVDLSNKLTKLAAEFPTVCKAERGLGLLRALPLADGIDARVVLTALQRRGLLLTIAGASALRFTPPLIVTEAEIDEAVAMVADVLSDVQAGRLAAG